MVEDRKILIEMLRMTAPGTRLRSGLDSILMAKTGALIVLGEDPEILALADGGFNINCDFSPSALYELSKMDGAIILSADGERIVKANTHLHPQVSKQSTETGIRHRVAQRVARQTGAMVIAISERRGTISLYKGNIKFVSRDIGFALTKANQAIKTLEKYREVYNEVQAHLSVLEIENLVTLNDVVEVVQKAAVVLHIMSELELYLCQLGGEGDLIKMQMHELDTGMPGEVLLVIKDYCKGCKGDGNAEGILNHILESGELGSVDPTVILKILGYGSSLSALERPVVPRGYRLVSKTARIPAPVVENLVQTFHTLPNLMRNEPEELIKVEGIGEVRARAIKSGLTRLRERLVFDRNRG